MKPPPVAYALPATLDEALDLLATSDDAAVIAGGQSLVPLLNLRLARPELLVDLAAIPGLDAVTTDGGELVVGAATTAATLLAHPACFDGLREALAEVGHPQIRSRPTVGGSIAHADPAAELPAGLAGLGGSVELASRDEGTRAVAATDFFDGAFSTTRRPDELLVAVRFPIPTGPSTFVEVARRHGDFALVGVFAAQTDRGLAFGISGVAGVPVRSLGGAGLDDLDPPDDIHASAEHRRALVGTLVARATERVADRAVAS